MTPQEQSREIARICALAPVIPVLVIDDAAQAVPLARALVAGGLPALEVTLRTQAALEAITAIAEVPGAVPGAGTLLTPEDVARAKAAGARFGVSPGATPALAQAAQQEALPLMPGAATPSEAMALAGQGYDVLKFFPAAPSGGVAWLRALAGPLPHLSFCPTGGIGPADAPGFLALDNVLAVGGSWVAPRAMVARGDWAGIEALAAEASGRGTLA